MYNLQYTLNIDKGGKSKKIDKKLQSEHDQYQLQTALKRSEKSPQISLEAGLLTWNMFGHVTEHAVIGIRKDNALDGYVLNKKSSTSLAVPSAYLNVMPSQNYKQGSFISITRNK